MTYLIYLLIFIIVFDFFAIVNNSFKMIFADEDFVEEAIEESYVKFDEYWETEGNPLANFGKEKTI